MRRYKGLLLVCAVSLLVSGCLYERQVSEFRRLLGGAWPCFEGEYAGRFQLTLVREAHKPQGIGRFPDGGKPFFVAAYIEVARVEETRAPVVGRIDLPLFRTGDFGNLQHRVFDCQEPNRLRYRVENGYGASRRVTEGVLLIPAR